MLFVIWIFRKTPRVRIDSLLDTGGVGDYGKDRGAATSAALEVIDEYPVFGAGVQMIYEMQGEAPHNMFLAMMVDYGIGGLILYLVVIIRLILIARRADRRFIGNGSGFCCMARHIQLRLAQSAVAIRRLFR